MAKAQRILSGTLILLTVVCLGFAAGFYASRITPQDKASQPAATSPSAIEHSQPNERIYRISPPSIGNGLITYALPALTFKDGLYFQKMSKKDADSAGLKKGQSILLYDKDGKLLDAMAEITALGENFGDTDEQITLIANFTQPGITPEFMVNRGEIITGKEQDLSRLPQAAIVKDSNGAPQIWEAHEDGSGKYQAKLVPLPVVRTEGDFVVIGMMPASSNLFILNPDKHLEEGQTIQTEKILYAGPGLTIDYGVKNRLDEITQAYSKMASVNRERQRKLSRVGTKGGSCGIPAGSAQRFIDTIKMRSSPPVFNPPNMSIPGSKQP